MKYVCNGRVDKVIYMGMPGELCRECNTLTGVASYLPLIASDTEFGPKFKFMVYEGSYWKALMRWLGAPHP